MAIIESATRLASGFIGILHTRLELAAIEVEEETLRFFGYLLFALLALFCLGVAILLGVLLIVVLFWDTHRVPVLIGLMAFFSVASLLIGLGIRRNYMRKPRLLAFTLTELKKDIDGVAAANH
ncbi:MAG: phage holin family protein [Pseudomonadota bacterium]